MAKIRINCNNRRMIVIEIFLLFLVISETNSDVNLFENYGLDRPLFPAWYKQSPSRFNFKLTEDSNNDRIYFMKDDAIQTPTCQNEDYCEDSANYPQELVKSKLLVTKGLYAVKDILTNDTDSLSVRIDADDQPMCMYLEKLIEPTTAKSVNGEWLFIAQDGQTFAQAVRIELCLEGSKPCRFVGKDKYICEQKYIYRKLVALKDDNLQPDYFRFPSSCCCALKKD